MHVSFKLLGISYLYKVIINKWTIDSIFDVLILNILYNEHLQVGIKPFVDV
jgi:hypothetical protein